MDSLDNKIKEFENKLNESFVERYESVKEWMFMVNKLLNHLNIKYKYESYNEFCIDYKTECLNFARKKQDMDFIDPRMILIWIPFVLSNLIVKKAHDFGYSKLLPLSSDEDKDKKEDISKVVESVKSSKEEKEIRIFIDKIDEVIKDKFQSDSEVDDTTDEI